MLDSAVLESLAKVVGGENILTDAYDLDRYSADALNPFRAFGAEEAFDRLADAVVRPSCAGEVAEVVRLASLEGIPVVPHGGGTGVMGGVLPVRGGIVLDLKRMNRILSINPTDLTAQVEPGVVLKDLVDALAEHGLMPGHDPYSVPIATVAGTISTNGVGYRAAAFGPMGNQVVALEVVLPDGRTMSTRPVPKYSSGPNLNHLFIGSEGVFGVITQATIQVFRLPEARTFSAVDFDSFDTGFQGAAEILALGIRPTLLDLSDDEEGIRLHLLFEGFKEGVAAQHQRSLEVLTGMGGRPAGPEPTKAYWRDRHRSGYNYKRTSLGRPRKDRWQRWGGRSMDYLHMALPISKVLEYRRRCEEIMEGTGVRVTEYAIWSRPELFSMLVTPAAGADDDFRANLAQVVEQVLTLAQDMGGIMEYCHGVGVKLNHLLAREMGVSHQVVGSIKQTLDPANILNPGKLGL